MSIWLPRLATDRLLRRRARESATAAHGERARGGRPESGPALVIVREHHGRQVVAHACARARAAGASPGLPASEARAVVGIPTEYIADQPERDAAMLDALAQWAHRIAPLVAVDAPDGLLIDVTGCGRASGGERAMVVRAVRDLARLGFEARAAIAPTFGCAWAVARYGTGRGGGTNGRPGSASGAVIADPEVQATLAPMPVAALRLEPGAIEGLAEVGITTIAKLIAVPRAALPGRFGPGVLLRLDQALGLAMESERFVRMVAPIAAEWIFDGPTTHWESIAHCVRTLLEDVCGQLQERESGARAVAIDLLRAGADPVKLALSTSTPARAPKHLWSMALPKLERADMGDGVEGVRIRCSRVSRVIHEQRSRWRDDAHAADHAAAIGELTDTLANRLGSARVLRAVLRESHIPERRESLIPALEADAAGAAEAGARAGGDAPTMLLANPIAAEAVSLSPDGPVLLVRAGGLDHTITRTIGPVRIGPEWWTGQRDTRDYYKVRDAEGRWLWVFRQQPTGRGGRWFVHGEWA